MPDQAPFGMHHFDGISEVFPVAFRHFADIGACAVFDGHAVTAVGTGLLPADIHFAGSVDVRVVVVCRNCRT